MTRDDIIQWTREAGGFAATPEFLERFAALVAAAEREACAKVADSMDPLQDGATEQEPVAWMNPSTPAGVFARHKMGAENFGCTVPLYTAPPRCPNCASLEAQNTELDARLAQLEQQLQAAYQRGRDDEAADQFRRTNK